MSELLSVEVRVAVSAAVGAAAKTIGDALDD